MIDKEKLMQAVKMFLIAIGEDPERNGLMDTPDRVARMCEELFAGYESDSTVHLKKMFDSVHSGLVIEKNIRFHSMCEHHILPFWGTVTIAYVPNGKVVGLSKLARTVEVYARRLQIQEEMTNQIASAIVLELNPKGVMVVVQAEHMCMSMRGVKKDTASTATVSAWGCFEDNYALQEQVMRSIAL